MSKNIVKLSKNNGSFSGENKLGPKDELFKLFISHEFFKNLKHSEIILLTSNSKIKNVKKTIKLSLNKLSLNKNFDSLKQEHNFYFLTDNYCIIYDNIAYLMVESNYKKIIVEIFYPFYLIDYEDVKNTFFDNVTLVIPRTTKLILIPKFVDKYVVKDLSKSTKVNENKISDIFAKYKDYILKKRLEKVYFDLVNYKSLDSLGRLLYFLYSYSKNFFFKEDYDVFDENRDFKSFYINKKLISFIIGNSHEVVIRNFRKLERLNYIKSSEDGIKINVGKLKQWVKNSKIIV